MSNTIHTFTEHGLGRAPFWCTGFAQETYQAAPDAPVQPGASCAYCGTGIINVFMIRSADGKVSKIGSTCINKSGDRGLINITRRELNRLNAPKKKARAKARVEHARQLIMIPLVIRALAEHPSPNEYRAQNNNETARDWAEFMLNECWGDSGKMEAVRYIKKLGFNC